MGAFGNCLGWPKVADPMIEAYKSLILLHSWFPIQKYKNSQPFDKLLLVGFFLLWARSVIVLGGRKWPIR